MRSVASRLYLGDVERDHNLAPHPRPGREHEGFDGAGVERGEGGAEKHRRDPGSARHCRGRGRGGEHQHRPGAGPGGGSGSAVGQLQLSKRVGRRISWSRRLGSINYLDWVVVYQLVVVVTKRGQFEELKARHIWRSPLTSPWPLSRVDEADDRLPGEDHRLSSEDHRFARSLEEL